MHDAQYEQRFRGFHAWGYSHAISWYTRERTRAAALDGTRDTGCPATDTNEMPNSWICHLWRLGYTGILISTKRYTNLENVETKERSEELYSISVKNNDEIIIG